MSALRRRLAFQPDIVEWVTSQKGQLKIVRSERYKMQKGIVAYARDIKDFIADVRGSKTQKTETPSAGAAPLDGQTPAAAASPNSDATKQEAPGLNRGMAQFYQSEELIKRMKWKRVTWDDDADYSAFSRRILENDSMFKSAPAFSYMSIHVVKDPVTTQLVSLPAPVKTIVAGDLTSWVLTERTPKEVAPYIVENTGERRSAFKVDWTSGDVRILDTASAQEILTFLTTVAPRLQALQVKMEEQQTRLIENLEKVRVRVGVTKVRFNTNDVTFWDDPKRKSNSNYLTPDDVEKFLDGILRSAFYYRWLLKGHELRIVPAGQSYFCDVENNEVHIPANFAEYNWMAAHSRYQSLEKVFEAFRKFWWFWFCMGMLAVGDLEVL